ncbi:hypothetical protein XENTR_v10016533 [Xenopus tropicalis]|nr:hypothetical protein XENTR_v10016533 [Xenopus tropicalis]
MSLSALVGDEAQLLNLLAMFMALMGLVSYVSLQYIRMPYGRYADSAFGPPVPVRLAWFVQEVPSLSVSLFFYLRQTEFSIANQVLMGAFICHYTQRTLIFPFLIRGGKPTPFASFALAFIFCCYNGYLQSSYLCSHAAYASDWIHDPRFITGIMLFFCGMFINIYSDRILRNLRKPGEMGYKIPKGEL